MINVLYLAPKNYLIITYYEIISVETKDVFIIVKTILWNHFNEDTGSVVFFHITKQIMMRTKNKIYRINENESIILFERILNDLFTISN